jgi:hypothetical protein
MTMNFRRQFYTSSRWVLLSYIAVLSCASTQAQKKSRYACDESQPETMCSAANTCGSASSECTINVTRATDSANVQPSTPSPQKNKLFCIKAGTTVVWKSSNKNNGFMISFGAESPFTPDGPIAGGGQKSVTTKATTPGCYKYDVGAFTSGTVYGMSGGNGSELVILP